MKTFEEMRCAGRRNVYPGGNNPEWRRSRPQRQGELVIAHSKQAMTTSWFSTGLTPFRQRRCSTAITR